MSRNFLCRQQTMENGKVGIPRWRSCVTKSTFNSKIVISGDDDDSDVDLDEWKDYCDGGVDYSVLLVYVDIGLNKNEFFKLQLLEPMPDSYKWETP